MTVPIQSQIYNPITGVFGGGNMQIFGMGMTGTFTIPTGVTAVRVRLWGAGGASGGSGGGFALKTIFGLVPGTAITVTVANSSAATSSFGSYVSATGGAGSGGAVGSGNGGDINTSGGLGYSGHGGGGSASLFGTGGAGSTGAAPPGSNGGSGGGGGSTGTTYSNDGGNGLFGSGGSGFYTSSSPFGFAVGNTATTNMPAFSIDFIGTGGGGRSYSTYLSGGNGINGGGGGASNGNGGYPGGGAGSSFPGLGMVIVEW